MAIKSITQNDLDNLWNKIKLEISEDQRKIRHETNNKIQWDYDKMDDRIHHYDTDLKLTKQYLNSMEKIIEKWLSEIKDEIKSIKNEFVTKSDLNPIKAKQDEHEVVIKRIAWGSFILLISIIWWFIWLSKFI